jgi:hypothetical protein
MTRDEMADRITFTLGLQDDTSFSETSYVTDLIYEGIVDVVARTRPYTRVINLTTTEDTLVHDMSTQIIALLDLADSQGFLDRYTREDIERAQRSGGTRGYCYEEPLLWVSPLGEQTLRAFGVFRPAKMTDGEQSPASMSYGGLAEEFHPTVITYCLWKGGEYVQHEASGNGEKWRIQYEGQDGMGGEISKIKRILLKRATPAGTRRRSPLRTVGYVPDADYFIGG